MRLQTEGDMAVFVEGLGPGQLVGRQALASVNYGDIQLSIGERKGCIEVEVIRARNLTASGSRLPATYVKVYMWRKGKCVAKARTTLARRTLDPLYQQQLIFHEDYREAVLQVWFSLCSYTSLNEFLSHNRSQCGVTTESWIRRSSWVWLRSCWTNWTCLTS